MKYIMVYLFAELHYTTSIENNTKTASDISMNENARILSAFENRLRAGFV